MKDANWQNYTEIESDIPEKCREWLCFPGQFTVRLKKFGIEEVDIKIVYLDWDKPYADECRVLNIHEPALIREVLISTGGKELMFARTVFPKETLTGKEEDLAHLGTRSLGSFLFKYPDLKRSEFQMAYLPSYASWARRSFFYVQDKSLLLTEVFLPAILELN